MDAEGRPSVPGTRKFWSLVFADGDTKPDSEDEIRALARHLGLSNWDKPQMACLSSRVEYGITITSKILSQVDRAEMALRRLGFSELRVRHHDKLARVEVEQRMIPRALARRDTPDLGGRREGGAFLPRSGARLRSETNVKDKREHGGTKNPHPAEVIRPRGH